MQENSEIYAKFPCILRKKFEDGILNFPDGTRFKYQEIPAYRVVKRQRDDNSPINRDDFRSYFELGQRPKPRGCSNDLLSDPTYYGVSCSTDRRELEQIMNFPRPNKKMAFGSVFSSGGPSYTKGNHICWWLYENVDIGEHWPLDTIT